MKAKEYRRQIEEQLDRDRANTLESLPGPRVTPTSLVEEALVRLADSGADSKDRLEMLRVLKAASFDIAAFAPFIADFQSTLQQIASSADGGLQLRREALEVLMAEHDDTARRILEAALLDPNDGDVPPAVALGLLARDDHGSALELARSVLETSSDPVARAQAVRVLGTSPQEANTLRVLLSDPKEARQVRKASAVALRALSPADFDEIARVIIADQNDFPDIRQSLEGVFRRQRRE